MKQQKRWLDQPQNVTRLIRGFSISCVILLLLDFILHRHSVHPLESIPGFYPLYGFVGCVLLVIVAKGLRLLLMRSENYYQQTRQHCGDQDDDTA